MHPISVAVRRGSSVESRHRVHAVLVREGRVIRAAGDPELVTYMRSAAKPFQALPLVREVPELPAEEIAIACASHVALPEQLAVVSSLLARAGAGEHDLECGRETASRLRHGCSGKHAGMLLLARRRGWSAAGYHAAGHPLQREMLAEVAAAAAIAPEEIATAIDGCGVLTFAVSLRRMAAAFSRLVSRELAGAERMVAAMTAHPELVGGPGVVDTVVMQALPGTVAKRGAEGVLCVGLADGSGAALKVEDGGARALAPAVARFVGLPSLAEGLVENSRGDPVGSIVAEP